MKYDTVVGLEVHIQMNTLSKAFCGDANVFGDEANTHISAISLAHPGTLPVANTRHVTKAIQLGLALGCRINQTNYFDRKHYFYPDSPKGYQITQDNQPICIGGEVIINVAGLEKKIRIHHIHMEEDAGKTIHDQHDHLSLIDLNRAGTPLLELVTEPDLSSGEEVYEFISELQKLIRYINVSDADMEKGSMRCDCNVSVKLAGATKLGERCEVKNLNSKRFAREAVKYEVKRQINMIEKGKSFKMQTLHYDPVLNKTSMLREKEGIADYRYLPDPDMPPIIISDEVLNEIKAAMPELPSILKQRLVNQDKLNEDYATQITQTPSIHQYYKNLCHLHPKPQACANLIINQVLPSLGQEKRNVNDFNLSSDKCASYLTLISEGKISASIAHQQLWPKLLDNPEGNPIDIANQLGLIIQEDTGELKQLIEKVLSDNSAQVEQYRTGKKALVGFFIGAVMRATGGNVDPKVLKKKLIEALEG